MNSLYREKHHRLPREYYQGNKTVSFTLCTRNRVRLFRNIELIEQLIRFLESAAIIWECDLLVYLFMPDHLHVLVGGKNERANPYNAIVQFKQRSGFYLYKTKVKGRWQKDFYDHILRREEDVRRHVRYILENPVRAGIVQDWRVYPFKGSMILDLSTWEGNW